MIGLEISCVKLNLTCEPDWLCQEVFRRYHEYRYDGTPDYSIRIKWNKNDEMATLRDGSIAQVEGGYSEGCYVVAAPQYSAMVDPKSRKAELCFSSTTPIYDIEYFLRIVISHGLFEKGGFLFHSTGIVRREKAYLLFGKSGSGKTTAARNSRDAIVLSDDLVGILPSHDRIMAYSTPFWNPGWEQYARTQAEVAGFYRLVKSRRVALEPMREIMAVSEILSSIPVLPMNEEFCTGLIPIIQSMVSQVGAYYLLLKRDDAFWEVLLPGEENN